MYTVRNIKKLQYEGGIILEFRTIKTFYTVVNTGSFQRAAEVLNYSQPTISMRIKQLEQDLDVQLFERGKTLKLTHAGRLFYERAGQLIAQYEVLDHTIFDLKNGNAGLIKVGISEPSASLVFPKILKTFLADFPKLMVNVSVDDANTCSQKLIDGEIDFAICGEPELILENFYFPFFHDSLDLIVSESHPLASRTSVELRDLRDECFIFTPANCPIRIQIEQHLKRAIGSDYKKMELTSSMSHKYFVRENVGVSIFTSTAHSELLDGTVRIPIENLPISPPIGLLTNQKEKDFDSTTKELIDRIIYYFDDKKRQIG